MIDINAKLGSWPYRPVKDRDALLSAMDRFGIERAAVSSLSAVHFLNPQDGNEALIQEVRPHLDRFTPFAVIRPNFALWEEDLSRCLEAFGMQGVVLHPNYHEFSLAGPALAPLMAEAARHRIPVCVQTGLEDLRRQFRPYKTQEVSPEAIGDLARAYPATTVIAFGLKFGQPEQMGEPLPPNLYFDTSNCESMESLETAVARFGSDRILFGTNFPLFNVLANVDKLRTAAITSEARQGIASGNAQNILHAF